MADSHICDQGKIVSCGAIILYCLNLPSEIRYLLENIFIVGLTPSPFKPDAVTLIHLLDPVIDTILQYLPPGKQITTHYHPEGVKIQARIIPLIADLPAAREAGGFLSHSATHFCSFCNCKSSDVESLDFTSWTIRNGIEVQQQAEVWRNLVTKADRVRQATATGVRWTSLHRLPYRDPVMHTILGFMHNWLEGVLQHQLRVLWGIGRPDETEQVLMEIDQEDQFSESELSESADELEQLRQEAIAVETGKLDLPPSSPSSNASTTPRATPNPFMNMDIDDDDPVGDPDYVDPPITQGSFEFTNKELEQIHSCIQNVSLPTWVGRPPTNLGEKGHGKLKAHQYLTLFTVIFPLILPKIWSKASADSALEHEMLESFYNLVASTNIIASFKTSNSEAESYTQHYLTYRASIQQLFGNTPSIPNHHFAMHNESLLKYWGPLAGLSEFPGERINGMLQKIKTNRHLCESHFSYQNKS